MLCFPLLLLDYDGTLAETRPAILRSLSRAFTACGIESPDDDALEAQLGRGGTLFEFYGAIVPGAPAVEAAEFVTAYRCHYDQADEEETMLFDDVPDVLAQLRQEGYCLVALSNKHAATLQKGLLRFGLSAFFAGIFGAEDHLPRKPEKTVWLNRVSPVFPQFGREAALMVGDTTADLRFARNARLASCWAEYGHGTKEACLELKPDYCISKITDLPGMLAGLKAQG